MTDRSDCVMCTCMSCGQEFPVLKDVMGLTAPGRGVGGGNVSKVRVNGDPAKMVSCTISVLPMAGVEGDICRACSARLAIQEAATWLVLATITAKQPTAAMIMPVVKQQEEDEETE